MENISPALLTFLFNATWQVALVAAVASTASRLLRGAPARFRHAVWVAALLLALALPLVNLAGGLRVKPRQPFNATAAASLPISATADTLDDTSLAASRIAASSAAVSPVRFPGELTIPGWLAAVLLSLYGALVLFHIAALLRAWILTRSLVRESQPMELPASVQRIIQRCLERTRVRDVRFVISTKVAAPLTFGAAPPMVVLPEKLVREGDEAMLTSAVGHELVHIARRDYVLNLLYRMLYIPLSFHPAASLIKRRIDETRELRCDELVTERLLSPAAYARSLVQLAGAAHAFRRPGTVAVGIADADILEERIMSMLNKRSISAARRALLLIAAALVLVMPCIAAAPYALHAGVAHDVISVAQPAAAQQPMPATQNSTSTFASNDAQEQRAKEKAEDATRMNLGFVYVPLPDGGQSPQESEARLKRKLEQEQRALDESEMTPEQRAAREKLMIEKLAMRARELAELSKSAKITMQQAIDAALRRQQGTVMESSMVGERRISVRQPDGTLAETDFGARTPMYRVVILSGDESAPVRTIVMVSALDGTILRTAVE